jgi:muconolactone delta-isomerase
MSKTPSNRRAWISAGRNYGWDLRGRFAGIYAPRNFGRDIRKSLDNLGTLLATLPNFDYTDVVVSLLEIPAQNILCLETNDVAARLQRGAF